MAPRALRGRRFTDVRVRADPVAIRAHGARPARPSVPPMDATAPIADPVPTATAETAPARAPRARRVAIPGGHAEVLDEVRLAVAARPGEQLVAQALATADGPLLRVGYARAGRVVRGPVTATPAEVLALANAVQARPAFASLADVAAPPGPAPAPTLSP